MTNGQRFTVAACACAALLTLGAPAAGADEYDGAETYADRREVREFVDQVAERHGFARDELLRLFAYAQFQAPVIKYITPPGDPKIRSWRAYRRATSTAAHRRRRALLATRTSRACARRRARFGVPPEIIVAIIGVETIYGR